METPMFKPALLVAAAALTLTACTGETTAEPAPSAPPTQSAEPSPTSEPSPASEPSPTMPPVEEAEADVDQITETRELDCVIIDFNIQKQWEDKGKSYEKLWLFPNYTVTNECDKKLKSVKFSFWLDDDFGDPWPGGYDVQQKVNLKPGETYTASSTRGYQHFDFDDNYPRLKETPKAELNDAVYITTLTAVFADGYKTTDVRRSN